LVIVPQSRARRDGLFGGLTAVFAVALVRGVIGASTAAGRTAAGVIIGLVLLVLVVGWLRALLRPAHLEISAGLIHYAGGADGQGGSRPDLSSDNGQEIRVYWRRAGRGSTLYLEQPATGVHWSLPYFSAKAVAEACRGSGWRVEDRRGR
jgi:hypothetical protein